MKRRHFLHNFAHAAAMPALIPHDIFSQLQFSKNSFLSNTSEQGNILVLIKLDGGNDGLNTLIPLDQLSNLNTARPHVILPESKILDLGTHDLGFHPALSDFPAFFEENRLKIIQNVGYPNPDFSHFRSMDIWQTASDSNEYFSSGWLGRYLENQHPSFPEAYPNDSYPHPLAVEMGWSASLAFTGGSSFTSFIARNPTEFAEIISDFDNVFPSNRNGEKLTYLNLIAKQANVYGEEIKRIYETGSNSVEYPNNNLGGQFEIVSRLINGGLNTRIYMVDLGDFDTHDTQTDKSDKTKGQHAALLQQLNDCVTSFIKNLDAAGNSDRVLTMTFSEFGRTIVSNGSEGTDHGTAAPLFLFGNRLNYEILGKNPVIPSNAQWQDNLEMEFDFRSIYASVINQWMTKNETTLDDTLFKNFKEYPIIQGSAADVDGDGVLNEQDQCNETPIGAIVDASGCAIFVLPVSNYRIKTNSATCEGKDNGRITVEFENKTHTYQVEIMENEFNFTYPKDSVESLEIEDLDAGNYTLKFTVDGQPDYEQLFEIEIKEPPALAARASVNHKRKTLSVNLSGSKTYLVNLNGETQTLEQSHLQVDLIPGWNEIKVSTPLSCQGTYEKRVFVSEEVVISPNPVEEIMQLHVPGTDRNLEMKIFSQNGHLLDAVNLKVPSPRMIRWNSSHLQTGIYLVQLQGTTVKQTLKIIKK